MNVNLKKQWDLFKLRTLSTVSLLIRQNAAFSNTPNWVVIHMTKGRPHEPQLCWSRSTQIYHLMTQTVVPRPIKWALTESSDQVQLSAFLLFHACFQQSAATDVIGRKEAIGRNQGTTAILMKRGKLVIHIASSSSADTMTATAAYTRSGVQVTHE